MILFPALVPFEQLAVSVLNPLTAWRLLNDFEYLHAGDTIIQNAGNSAVGQSIIQFAKKMGLQCISLVRNLDSIEYLAFGFTEACPMMMKYQDELRYLLRIRDALALNSVGNGAIRFARSCPGEHMLLSGDGFNAGPLPYP